MAAFPNFPNSLSTTATWKIACASFANSSLQPHDCDLDQIRQELLCLSHEKLSRLRRVPIEVPEGKFLATRRVSRC